LREFATPGRFALLRPSASCARRSSGSADYLNGVAWRQPFTRLIEQLADQWTPHSAVRPSHRPDGMQLQEFLHLVSYPGCDDRLMLPWISRAFVANFTNVDRVAQQCVKRSARERLRTACRVYFAAPMAYR
jgi:hypothetical protein